MGCNNGDVAAERAVLAGIMAGGGDVYVDVADLVTPLTFTVGSNQCIYRCLEHILKEEAEARPDLPTLLSAANSLGLSDFFGKKEELEHLRAVTNLSPLVEISNVRKLAGKIRKLEIARLLEDQLGKARGGLAEITGDEPIAHIIGLVENPIFDLTSLLSNTASQGVVSMGEGALQYVQFLMDNPRQMMGIPTGLRRYDHALGGGIRENALDIVAARQKTGKTMLVDNIGLNVAETGIHVLNVDTEMSKEEHLHRILANLAGLDTEKVEMGQYGKDPRGRRKLEEAARKLADLPYDYLSTMGMPFEDILAHMRRWLLRKVGLDENGRAKPCLIIYDWLKLNSAGEVNKNIAEHQLLGFITSGLKNFMGRYGARCLCFAQLNREGIDVEDTRVIRGSDRILDFCTSFSIYKWKADEEMAEAPRYSHKLIPVVSRFGKRFAEGNYINIQTIYEQGKIIEGPTRDELARGQDNDNGPGQAARGFVVDGDQQEVEFGE